MLLYWVGGVACCCACALLLFAVELYIQLWAASSVWPVHMTLRTQRCSGRVCHSYVWHPLMVVRTVQELAFAKQDAAEIQAKMQAAMEQLTQVQTLTRQLCDMTVVVMCVICTGRRKDASYAHGTTSRGQVPGHR